MSERTSASRLRRAVEALPEGASLMLTREVLLEALGDLADTPPPDQLLTVRNAATRLKVSKKWLYRHADKLPYARRLSPHVLRFSERGIEEALERRREKKR